MTEKDLKEYEKRIEREIKMLSEQGGLIPGAVKMQIWGICYGYKILLEQYNWLDTDADELSLKYTGSPIWPC